MNTLETLKDEATALEAKIVNEEAKRKVPYEISKMDKRNLKAMRGTIEMLEALEKPTEPITNQQAEASKL